MESLIELLDQLKSVISDFLKEDIILFAREKSDRPLPILGLDWNQNRHEVRRLILFCDKGLETLQQIAHYVYSFRGNIQYDQRRKINVDIKGPGISIKQDYSIEWMISESIILQGTLVMYLLKLSNMNFPGLRAKYASIIPLKAGDIPLEQVNRWLLDFAVKGWRLITVVTELIEKHPEIGNLDESKQSNLKEILDKTDEIILKFDPYLKKQQGWLSQLNYPWMNNDQLVNGLVKLINAVIRVQLDYMRVLVNLKNPAYYRPSEVDAVREIKKAWDQVHDAYGTLEIKQKSIWLIDIINNECILRSPEKILIPHQKVSFKSLYDDAQCVIDSYYQFAKRLNHFIKVYPALLFFPPYL